MCVSHNSPILFFFFFLNHPKHGCPPPLLVTLCGYIFKGVRDLVPLPLRLVLSLVVLLVKLAFLLVPGVPLALLTMLASVAGTVVAFGCLWGVRACAWASALITVFAVQAVTAVLLSCRTCVLRLKGTALGKSVSSVSGGGSSSSSLAPPAFASASLHQIRALHALNHGNENSSSNNSSGASSSSSSSSSNMLKPSSSPLTPHSSTSTTTTPPPQLVWFSSASDLAACVASLFIQALNENALQQQREQQQEQQHHQQQQGADLFSGSAENANGGGGGGSDGGESLTSGRVLVRHSATLALVLQVCRETPVSFLQLIFSFPDRMFLFLLFSFYPMKALWALGQLVSLLASAAPSSAERKEKAPSAAPNKSKEEAAADAGTFFTTASGPAVERKEKRRHLPAHQESDQEEEDEENESDEDSEED
jgi:hypothetical protein